MREPTLKVPVGPDGVDVGAAVGVGGAVGVDEDEAVGAGVEVGVAAGVAVGEVAVELSPNTSTWPLEET
jgi:hypothetical protein